MVSAVGHTLPKRTSEPAATGNLSLAEAVVVHEAVQIRTKLLGPHVRTISDAGVNWPVLVQSPWRVCALGHVDTVFGEGHSLGSAATSGVSA